MVNIKGCLLSFYCSQDWNTLVATSDPRVKFCKECGNNLRFCKTFDEFDEMARTGHCVALRDLSHTQTDFSDDFYPYVTVGIPIVRNKQKK